MRKGFVISGLASLLLLLAGCAHKKPAAAPPPQAQAPTQPAPAPPPPLKLPKPAPTAPPAQTEAPTETKPAEPVHHKRLKPSPETASANPQTTQTASAAAPASASAIGQLSEGGSGSSGDMRNQTVGLIASIERKLKEISRPLSEQEQATAAQVRKFLQQASDALHNQDVDAAHTLATKADVLLNELLK